MENLILYLLKVSLAIILFYGLHVLLLRNETFFKLRRFYFLFALIFSLIYPLISIDWAVSDTTKQSLLTYNLSEAIVWGGTQTAEVGVSSQSIPSLSITHVAFAVALLGALVLLARFAMQLLSLVQQIGKMKLSSQQNVIWVDSDAIPSFSFFRWIVVNQRNTSEQQQHDILQHEEAHVRQLHSIDVLLYELFCILFWWNPFAWLLKREMKLNLEFLADNVVQRDREEVKNYQYTLLQISIANTGMAFINNFNITDLKKRITMMNKKRTSNLWISKYFTVVPVILALLLGNMAFTPLSASKMIENLDTNNDAARLVEDTIKTKKQVFTIVDDMPGFPGGEMEMMKYIGTNLRYPKEAQDAGAEGRILVRFVVTETGDLTDVEIVRNSVDSKKNLDEVIVVGYGSDHKEVKQETLLEEGQRLVEAEAIRVVKSMPTWKPGTQNGKKVPVYFTLPILFRLK